MEKPFKKLNKKRQTFFFIGLILSLSIVLFAFNYGTEYKPPYIPTISIEHDPTVMIHTSHPKPIELKHKDLLKDEESRPKKDQSKIILVDPSEPDLFADDLGLDTIVEPEDEWVEIPIEKFISDEIDIIASFDNLGEWLQDNLLYDVRIADLYNEPIIKVKLVVLADGSIYRADVVESPDQGLSASVLAAIRKMPKWKAGEVDGKKINQELILPIRLKVR